jgi:hypothetical protein
MTNCTTNYKYSVGASQKGALTICLILGTLVSGFSEAGPITTFDAPGAGTGTGQGTFAININGFDVAVGYFVDANMVFHGFVRSPFGKMVTIDAPGAGTVPGANQGTIPESINIEGTIAGQYEDANDAFHCFLRYPDGHIITFDAPRAGTGPGQGSLAVDINTEGTIAGYTIDDNNVMHGFVRSPLGIFTSFDAPETGKGAGEGTTVSAQSGLNSQGILIGSSIVVSSRLQGFMRERSGAVTLFDPPGSVITVPRAINSDGLIVGGAADANFIFHGFVRSVNGAITTFDVPGAGTTPGSFEGTQALGVSSFGLSTGKDRLKSGCPWLCSIPERSDLKIRCSGSRRCPWDSCRRDDTRNLSSSHEFLGRGCRVLPGCQQRQLRLHPTTLSFHCLSFKEEEI